MRKLSAALTLRGVRHGKESTSVLLHNDGDSSSSGSGSSISSSSSSDDSSSGSDRKSQVATKSSSTIVAQTHNAEPVSPQKKVLQKVRASIATPFSGRKSRPKSLPVTRSAEIKVNRDLLPATSSTTREAPKSPVVRSTSGTSMGSGKGMSMMFMSDMKGADDFFAYHNRTIKETPAKAVKGQPTTKDESSSPVAEKQQPAVASPRRSRTPYRAREKGTTYPATFKHQRSKSMGAPSSSAVGEIDTSSPLKRMVRSDHQTSSPTSRPRPTTPFRHNRTHEAQKSSESEKGDLSSVSHSSAHTRKELVPVTIDNRHHHDDDVPVQPYAQLALGGVVEPTLAVGGAEIDTSSPLKRMVKSEENLAAAAAAEAEAEAAANSNPSPVRRSTTPFRRSSRALDQMTDQEKDALKYGAQPYRPKTPLRVPSGDDITVKTPARKTPLQTPSEDDVIQIHSDCKSTEGPVRRTPLRAPSGDCFVKIDSGGSCTETPRRKTPLRAPSGDGLTQMHTRGSTPPSRGDKIVETPRRKTPLRAPSGDNFGSEILETPRTDIDSSSPLKRMVRPVEGWTGSDNTSPVAETIATKRSVTPYRRKVESTAQDQDKSLSRSSSHSAYRSTTPYRSKKDNCDPEVTHTSSSRRKSQAPSRHRSITPYRGTSSQTTETQESANAATHPLDSNSTPERTTRPPDTSPPATETSRRRSTNVSRRGIGGGGGGDGGGVTPSRSGRLKSERSTRSALEDDHPVLSRCKSERANRGASEDVDAIVGRNNRSDGALPLSHSGVSVKSVASIFEKEVGPPSTLLRPRSKSTSKRLSSTYSNKLVASSFLNEDTSKGRSKSTGRAAPSSSTVPLFAPPKNDTKHRTK